jgi:RNA polymerase sigma-70 factor (ECF subfamily)
LGVLCQKYWFPLYAYLRRWGFDTHRAEDCTQAFFTRLLEKRSLSKADRSRGRFRSFLLTSLKNFLNDEWDHSRAQKRGGDKTVLSLDTVDAETRYTLEPADRLSPDRLFERSWALTILNKALDRLKEESTTAGKKPLFEHLKKHLTSKADKVSYTSIAVKLDMTEDAVKASVYRLRRRYRELVREEIAQTVITEEQVEEEIQALFAALTI